MVLFQLQLQILQFLTVHMEQLSAFLAFTVKTGFLMHMIFLWNIFKTGRTSCIDHIFIYDAFFYKLFQLPVNRCFSDGRTISAEMIADHGSSAVLPVPHLQIVQQLFPLFCPIRRLHSKLRIVLNFSTVRESVNEAAKKAGQFLLFGVSEMPMP